MSRPGWEHHEKDIQELLGLDSTICSGNKHYDPGDAVDNRHPRETLFPLVADCKYTDHVSKSIRLAELQQWSRKAQEFGKRFIMPIRFWPRGQQGPHDYVLLSLDDFAELLSLIPEDDHG